MSWKTELTVSAVKSLYERRSNTGDILDVLPENRVTWTEVWALMKDHGYSGNVVDGRLDWHKATRGIKWPEGDLG